MNMTIAIGTAGEKVYKGSVPAIAAAIVLMIAIIMVAAAANAEVDPHVTVVYSARAEYPMDLSDEALTGLAREKGTIEIWTRRVDGTVKRELSRLGDRGVANPGFTSFQREEYEALLEKGYAPDILKDGSEQLTVALNETAVVVFSHEKRMDGPSFEMNLLVNGEKILSERRYEQMIDGQMRLVMLRVDYPGGAIIQIFEFTDDPPPALPPVFLRKVGVDDDAKSDVLPKSYVTKDSGDDQTREAQFIVPPQGIGSMGFDSGWVPGGEGDDPGGFIIQVRINATGGYTYDAAVNGAFNLTAESFLGLGPAAGAWGFYFGAQFFFKAAFDIPPILGFDLDPFIVDIPYVPDFNLVTSDRDHFNSWLLEEVSTVRDESGRFNVADVDLISLLISGGVLPSLPSWVPLPKVGAALDVGAVANGHLSCDNVALSDGTVFTEEGQALPIYIPESGYHAIAEYNEDASLNLGVKFYPYVFFRWFGFGWSWPAEGDDNLLTRLEWLPVAHRSFPFTSAELNFTGLPSTQPANDWFTQQFQAILDQNNISFKRVRFTPNQSNNFYSACLDTAAGYRTDPSGGNVVLLGNDDFVLIPLAGGKEVSLYGNRYSSFYIGSNGYITFAQGDTTKNVNLENHFNQPRISGLFLDLKPNDGGTVSWKQLPNRVVVTYHGVRLSNIITEQTANFQIEMFFDGRIIITWLHLDTYIGLIGLSRGGGVPDGYQKSRFANYAGCLGDIALEGGIRVNFAPPEVIGYEPRWRVGTGPWRQSGTYDSAPLGQHTVYFNYIPIYWETPAPIVVNMTTPDAFVDLTPVYVRATGDVSVSTQPATASWVLTDPQGMVHSGTGAMAFNDMPTGNMTIAWQPLPTYSLPVPATQQVMLYPDTTVSFTGVYAPIIGEGQATLVVNLSPGLANASGARWRVNGGEWRDSGASATIPDGNSLLEFTTLVGWTQPDTETIFFARDQVHTLNKTYTRHTGSVTVHTSPHNAPWTLVDGNGVEHTGVGYAALDNVPTGDALSVAWGNIATYTPPVPNPYLFSLAQNDIHYVAGNYVPILGEGEGILRVILQPPAAANAGARWRLLGGDWLAGGAMTAVVDGERTIKFKDVPGWLTPPDRVVFVPRDVTTDVYQTYERLTGTVSVLVNPKSAHWTLHDMDGGVHSATGDAVLDTVPSGEITIHWTEIEGHEAPQPNPATHLLESGGTLEIVGNYVEAIVTADFAATATIGTAPFEVLFHDQSHSTTKEIAEWRWYFGDGRTSTDRHPRHTYREPGQYTVTLFVSTYEQMNAVSKTHFVVVLEGVPVAGPAGLAGLVLVLVLVGAAGAFKRRK